MMHKLYDYWYLAALSIGVLLLTGCANVHYANDYKTGTDFSQLKTYSWRAVTVDIGGANHALLQNLADQQLQAQGFIPVKDQPDMLIDMQIFARASTGGNSSIGVGIGLPVGRHGSIGLGTSQLLNREKQEGVIVVDITQAKSNSLIWRGNAEGIPLAQFSLSAEHKLGETMAQLLSQFPPAATAP